jgi:hypothetical protein
MTIEERLENMEKEMGRQKRRYRWLLGAILLVAGGLFVPIVFEATAFRAKAQAGGTVKEIRANNIVLEDANGKVRALLTGEDEEGRPGLALSDENGKTRVWLHVNETGPTLVMTDETGKPSVWLSVIKSGPVLRLNGEKAKTGFVLSVIKEGPQLGLHYESDMPRAVLSVTSDGPSLDQRDENDMRRSRLAVTKDGPALLLFDENGKLRFDAGKSSVITPKGKIIAYPESSLVLFGPDGKLIWSAIK